MKLESQVCSLELAKKLKELGVVQVSTFYWQGMKSELATGKGCDIHFGIELQFPDCLEQ
jgi:hypothetical protein